MVAQSDWLPMMIATSARLLFNDVVPGGNGRALVEFMLRRKDGGRFGPA